MRKILALLLIAVIVFGVSQNPHRWAQAGKHAGDKIAQVADGFGTFFTDLAT